jgi:hypothetical protein
MEYFGWTESDSQFMRTCGFIGKAPFLLLHISINLITGEDLEQHKCCFKSAKKSLDRLYSLCLVCSSFDQSLSNNLERRIYE